jgi:hypothetical protein
LSLPVSSVLLFRHPFPDLTNSVGTNPRISLALIHQARLIHLSLLLPSGFVAAAIHQARLIHPFASFKVSIPFLPTLERLCTQIVSVHIPR